MRIRRPRGERKKTCSKCGGILDKGLQRYCKKCHKEYMRAYRAKPNPSESNE